MRSRIKELIRYVRGRETTTARDLAQHMGVGERTIRRYIGAANDLMGDAGRICFNHGSGYILAVADPAALDILLAADGPAAGAVPTSPRERVSYLLSDLLSRTDWVTLDTLAGVLYVSRRTVSSDLREVEARIERFGLSLESKPYRGIRIAGGEMARRLCLANTVVQQVLDAQGTGASSVSIEDVAACVDDAFAAAGGPQISSSAYQNLLVHIAVAIVRIREGMYVPMADDGLARVERASEYATARRIAANLERRFDVELPSAEVAYIALHLVGKKLTLDSVCPLPADAAQLAISDQIWQLVSDMLEAIWQAYRFDLRGDLELRMNLARHIVPLSVRLIYRMPMDNPLVADIKARFPLAWSMAVDSSAVLRRAYDAELDEAEIGYLALALALAVERAGDRPVKKRVLVVCASGAGSARLLAYRCQQEFGAYIDHIETCDRSQVGQVDFTDIDYVFTTVPLPPGIPVPVREVGVFLDPDDVSGIMDLLRRSEPAGLLAYFPPELFFGHLPCASKDEVLDTLITRVVQRRSVPADFRELVLRREEVGPTSFGSLTAIPHPLRAIDGPPFVAVGLLDAPVAWGDHEVRAVFLIAFSSDPDVDFDAFGGGIAELLSDTAAIERLIRDQTYETLEAILTGRDAT